MTCHNSSGDLKHSSLLLSTMGIHKLWKVVKPVATEQSLAGFCLDGAILYGENETFVRPLVIGFDTSIWLHECQAQFFHRHHAQMGENPELRTLFHRLARLLHMCIVPVFVFDGPNRPRKKRGKKVSTKPHWLTARFKEFIEAFGFYSHMAPGEAEAELAYLNQHGFIDAVVTDDSDTFVFGAKCVLKSIKHTGTNKKAVDMVEVYKIGDISSSPSVGLNDGGLLLYALLSGGDYSSGLFGCGAEIAHGLAQTTLGTDLLSVATIESAHELCEYLPVWRDELKAELQDNTQGHLRRHQPAIASRLSPHFPDIETVLQYTKPFSSASTLSSIDASRWALRNINTSKLVKLCENAFSWGTATGIARKFIHVIWSGVLFRTLLQWTVQEKYEDDYIFPTIFQSARRLPETHLNVDLQYFSIKVYIQHLTQILPHYMIGNRGVDDVPVSSLEQFIQVKVPSILVKSHLPHLFAEKKRRHRSERSLVGGSLRHEEFRIVGGSSCDQGDVIDLTGDAD